MGQYLRSALDVALVLACLVVAVLARQVLGVPVWVLGPALMVAVFGALWACDEVLPAHEEEA